MYSKHQRSLFHHQNWNSTKPSWILHLWNHPPTALYWLLLADWRQTCDTNHSLSNVLVISNTTETQTLPSTPSFFTLHYCSYIAVIQKKNSYLQDLVHTTSKTSFYLPPQFLKKNQRNCEDCSACTNHRVTVLPNSNWSLLSRAKNIFLDFLIFSFSIFSITAVQ